MRLYDSKKMRKVPDAPKEEPPVKASMLRRMANEIVDAVAVLVEKLQLAVEKAQEKLRTEVGKVALAQEKVETRVVEVAKVARRIDGAVEAQMAVIKELQARPPERRATEWKFIATKIKDGRWEVTAKALN